MFIKTKCVSLYTTQVTLLPHHLSQLVIYEHCDREMVRIYSTQCPVTEMSRCRAENSFFFVLLYINVVPF